MAIKLSNAQVAALAAQIIEDFNKEVKAPIKKFNKDLEKSYEFQNFCKINDDCKKITEIQERLGSDSYYFNYVRTEIRSIAFEKRFKKEPSLSETKVITQIHLATIDATDLDTLIKAVSEKFKSEN